MKRAKTTAQLNREKLEEQLRRARENLKLSQAKGDERLAAHWQGWIDRLTAAGVR